MRLWMDPGSSPLTESVSPTVYFEEISGYLAELALLIKTRPRLETHPRATRRVQEIIAGIQMTIDALNGEQANRSQGGIPLLTSYGVSHLAAQQTRLNDLKAPAGLEEVVGRRDFLAAAVLAVVAPQHLMGAFVDGRPDQMAPDEDLAVANLEKGRKETFIVDLNQSPSATLPPLTRIFVQRGASIPSIWKDVAPEELDADPAKAQKRLEELAQAGEIVLVAPSDDETALGWDQFLRARQLLGIQTTTGLLNTLERLTPTELPLFLASLGPAGGLILDASLRQKATGTKELIISA